MLGTRVGISTHRGDATSARSGPARWLPLRASSVPSVLDALSWSYPPHPVGEGREEPALGGPRAFSRVGTRCVSSEGTVHDRAERFGRDRPPPRLCPPLGALAGGGWRDRPMPWEPRGPRPPQAGSPCWPISRVLSGLCETTQRRLVGGRGLRGVPGVEGRRGALGGLLWGLCSARAASPRAARPQQPHGSHSFPGTVLPL